MTWMHLKNSNDVVHEGMIFTEEAACGKWKDIPNLFQEAKARKK